MFRWIGFLCVVWIVNLAPTPKSSAHAQVVDSAWLKEQTDGLAKEARLLSAGATVMTNGEVIATAVSGRRKMNTSVLVTADDQWHLGSITKSMTATVIARLVEKQQLSWDSTLSEMLPKEAAAWHDGWNQVTLMHLLTHTSGLPANFPVETQLVRPVDLKERHEARRTQLMTLLADAPGSSAGSTMLYSNVGYTLAGFIAAEKAGTTWEELMQRELFEPLKLSSAGFGPPRGKEPLDQPWGHQRSLGMRIAGDPDQGADNTPIMGPAGTVHMTMHDLARFGWEHRRGEREDTALLKAETFRKLHTGVKDDYACGWVEWDRDWADGRVIWHNGSNTFWYTLVALVPSRNAVIVIVTNDGNIEKAQPAFFEFTETITKQIPKN